MAVHEVMPGYWTNSNIFEQVREHLANQHPHLLPDLAWEQFVEPAGGVFAVPDPAGNASKVEMILIDTPAATVKVNHWFRPDVRRDGRPTPHNHRWRTMRSRILQGGYTEFRYTATAGGVEQACRDYGANADNVLEHHVFHEVADVELGTWSVFVGDASQPGDWGYLDPDSGQYVHNAAWAPDPGFGAAFAKLNPHLR